jgi:glutathione S-transferase
MYTLYYSPGSASLVVHCLLEELGVPFELKRVDVQSKDGYRKLNPKGKVPAIAGPDGLLTESVAIVQYLCDRHDTQRHWLAAPDTWERAQTLEQVATLATEIHPVFNRFFHADDFSGEEGVQTKVKNRGAEKLTAWFRDEDACLTGPNWSGDDLTIADIYFMVMARWGRWLDPPANEMRNIRPFYERMVARPAMARAFAAEGIKAFGTT